MKKKMEVKMMIRMMVLMMMNKNKMMMMTETSSGAWGRGRGAYPDLKRVHDGVQITAHSARPAIMYSGNAAREKGSRTDPSCGTTPRRATRAYSGISDPSR